MGIEERDKRACCVARPCLGIARRVLGMAFCQETAVHVCNIVGGAECSVKKRNPQFHDCDHMHGHACNSLLAINHMWVSGGQAPRDMSNEWHWLLGVER